MHRERMVCLSEHVIVSPVPTNSTVYSVIAAVGPPTTKLFFTAAATGAAPRRYKNI
jgi:hypothetical protein